MLAIKTELETFKGRLEDNEFSASESGVNSEKGLNI